MPKAPRSRETRQNSSGSLQLSLDVIATCLLSQGGVRKSFPPSSMRPSMVQTSLSEVITSIIFCQVSHCCTGCIQQEPRLAPLFLGNTCLQPLPESLPHGNQPGFPRASMPRSAKPIVTLVGEGDEPIHKASAAARWPQGSCAVRWGTSPAINATPASSSDTLKIRAVATVSHPPFQPTRVPCSMASQPKAPIFRSPLSIGPGGKLTDW
jgi:hypothetical protein